MSIDARMLTSAAEDNGSHDLKMDVAICSFDRSGKAMQYFQEKVSQQFAAQPYASMRGVPHVIEFPPAAGAARVRLVVRDAASAQARWLPSLRALSFPVPPDHG